MPPVIIFGVGMFENAGSENDGHFEGEPLAPQELRQLVERIEQLEREKSERAADVKDVYAEAKGRGFSVKALRIVVRKRKQDRAERQEEEAVVGLYSDALGL